MKVKRVYEQVRDHIEHDARQRAPGEALPSEMKYARDLDVSRLTVRKAVDDLVAIGLVKRLPGKGLIALDEPAQKAPYKLLFSLPFVVSDSDFFDTMMACVDAANALGCEYKILPFTDVDERLEMIRKEDLGAFSGAVITCYESEADRLTLGLLKAAGVPVITMGDNREDTPCIMGDDFNGGYLIGEHLVRMGHRDILFLTSDRPVSSVQLRAEGFRQALLDNGVTPQEDYIVSVKDPGTPLLPQHAQQRTLPPQVDRFLKRELPFTALSGYSTLPILSMCTKMHEQGFSIPEDVSVVGYGNLPYMREQNLLLTSVQTANSEHGAGAVQSLYDYLTGQKDFVESRLIPVKIQSSKSVRSLAADELEEERE